ncbi:putative autotransporter adhesin-like protein [Lutibacter sp. Hel_I_33_5]|uniref:head GIN domain-containing protein n=1 Tax=Lutibacter sp. Hel_I_33_5 TaxID=1566289 RepID=UPI0011A9B5A3|nr:head GIN domain-containing protein [Lutibacter sp. Hel_I_33_5]TVZ55762.1 putative autotransporter adhesin-like protein [Lutibacter sp. Hel_I_33_5]
MKTTISKIAVLLFLATLTTSCFVDGFNKINGDRNVITEERSVTESFTKVRTSSGIDVYITQGDKEEITIEADENLHRHIKTEIENGTLKIYSKRNIWRAKARKVHVTVKTIEGITATSGSDVYSENTLKSDTFKASTSSGADMKLSIDANSVTSKSTSGSDLKLLGKAEEYSASASSGSSTNSFGLHSKNVTVRVSSGADINVYASNSIDAKASSGGDIDYKGNPEKVNKRKSSGGSISSY